MNPLAPVGWRVAVALALALAAPMAAAEPAAPPPGADHVDLVLNGIKVRVTLVQAERMRHDVVDRIAGSPKPEVAALRQALATAVPWVDPGGQLHYGPWSLLGTGPVITLSAAFPPLSPLGLKPMGSPGLHATFVRRGGRWQLTDVDEASTTR